MLMIIYYALYDAMPSREPPFEVHLGYAKGKTLVLKGCQSIADATELVENYCKTNLIQFADNFTLVYPIYLQAKNTKYESVMHQTAWLIKEEADKKGWDFERVGGYTNKMPDSLLLTAQEL